MAKCSKCGQEGHNALTCGKERAEKKAAPAKAKRAVGGGIVLKADAQEIVLRLRVLVSIETA